MPSPFIQDILDRIEKLEGKQPTADTSRMGYEVVPLEQEVRKLNVSKEYRRRIEDLEARWAVLSLHFSGFDNKTHLRANAVVDSDGKGTHVHLRNAILDAIADGGDYFIWINQSATASNMDLKDMGSAQNIYIEAADRTKVLITGASGEDIFVQSGTGGQSGGGLHFRNVAFTPAANQGVYANTGTGSTIDTLEFLNCTLNAGYFARQTGLNTLGGMALKIHNCNGDALGFYETEGSSGTLAPDKLQAVDNYLTLNEWWTNDNNKATPDFMLVFGGEYNIATQLNIADGTDNSHWHGFRMKYAGSNPAFLTSASGASLDDLSWTSIVFQTSNAGGSFCDLGIAANSGNGLFIHGIHGFPIHGLTVTGGTIFIEIGDSSNAWVSAHVSDIFAPEWPVLFEGNGSPLGDTHALLSTTHSDTTVATVTRGGLVTGVGATPKWTLTTVGADGSLFSSDGTDISWQTDIHLLGYLGIGSAAAPTNVTAGDLTVTRLLVTNAALDSSARIMQVSDTYTPATGQFNSLFVTATVDPGTGSTTDDQRAATFAVHVQPTANYTGTTQAFFASATHDSGSFNVAALRGFFAQAIQDVGSTTATVLAGAQVAYRALDGTITTAVGMDIVRGNAADGGAIGTGIGLRIGASAGVTPTADIAIQSLGGQHRFVGSVRIGANTAPTVALDVTGAVKVSTTLAVTGATTLSGGIATSTTLTGTLTTTGNIVIQGGSLQVGVDDTTSGLIKLFGASAGQEGGELQFYLTSGNQSNFDNWSIDANADDLRFFQGSGEQAMRLRGSGGNPSALFPYEVEIDGALNHDGSTVGFYGVTPATRPTAFTQTYSTATKTHSNPTAAAPGDLVATSGGWGADSEVNFDKISTALDALVADMANVKQVVNQIIDDLQTEGLLQ